jgi:hypothetical protein
MLYGERFNVNAVGKRGLFVEECWLRSSDEVRA